MLVPLHANRSASVANLAIDPVVMETVQMKEIGMPLTERFQHFPWLLSDLIFPLMMEYLVRRFRALSNVPPEVY
jgi:hypothetical protein